jgi:hypothetical protein
MKGFREVNFVRVFCYLRMRLLIILDNYNWDSWWQSSFFFGTLKQGRLSSRKLLLSQWYSKRHKHVSFALEFGIFLVALVISVLLFDELVCDKDGRLTLCQSVV